MREFVKLQRLPRLAQPVAGFLIGGVGAAGLSVVTSEGYLHAARITGAGNAGSTTALDPIGQLLMLIAWIAIGTIAGFVGRTGLAFAGLWLGALGGSALGFLSDPGGNILWLDVIVTVVGVTIFITPGFLIGALLASQREGLVPDGSGSRPPPPPLWAVGRRAARESDSETEGSASTLPTWRSGSDRRPGPGQPSGQPATGGYPPSAYARPGSQRPDSA